MRKNKIKIVVPRNFDEDKIKIVIPPDVDKRDIVIREDMEKQLPLLKINTYATSPKAINRKKKIVFQNIDCAEQLIENELGKNSLNAIRRKERTKKKKHYIFSE